jgi:sigma-E factor negative regulatory protein RseC
MIEQQGTVVAVSQGLAQVRVGAVAGCPACDAGKGCGAGVFGRMLQRKPVLLQFPNHMGAGTGQPVVIGISENVFLRLLLRLYLLPLLVGFAGAALGYFLASTHYTHPGLLDAATAFGAVFAGGLTLWLLRTGPQDFSRNLNPKLLRLVSESSMVSDESLLLPDTPCNK